jgi:hypothetical protein
VRMVYHPGKVLELFPKKGKDDDTQAMVEFWDENLSVVRVDRKIEGSVKKGDMVLVDYYPSETKPHNPRWLAVKIVDSKKSDAVWKKFKQHHSRLKMMASSTMPPQPQHNVGIG